MYLHARFNRSAIIALLLLCVAGSPLLQPANITAAQIDEATPIVSDPSLGATDLFTSNVTATFVLGVASATPGSSILGASVTFTMTDENADGYIGVELPAGWTSGNLSTDPSSQSSDCVPNSVNPGVLRAYIESHDPGSTCVFSFDLAIPADTIPTIYTIDTNIDAEGFPSVGSTTLEVVPTTITPNFSDSSYRIISGLSSTAASFRVAFDGASPGGTVTITNPASTALSFQNLRVNSSDTELHTACPTPVLDDSGNITFVTSSTGPGFCDIGFDIAVASDTAPGTITPDMTASMSGVVLATSPAATVEILPAMITFNPVSFSAKPGASIPVEFTYHENRTSLYWISLSLPAGWTFGDFSDTAKSGDIVTCDDYTVDENVASGSSGSFTGGYFCTYETTIIVPADAIPGTYTIVANASSVTNPVASAGITITPPAAASFDAYAYSAVPGGSTEVVVQLQYGLEDVLGNYTIVNPDPAQLTFSDVQIANVGGSNITTATIDPGTGNVTGVINAAVGGTSTLTITVNVDPGATFGPAGNLTGTMPTGVLDPEPASFTVLDPHLPTGAFDAQSYAAQPGAATNATYTIHFAGVNPGGSFTIANPDQNTLTFSNPVVQTSGDATCDNLTVDIDSNITGATAATDAGSCNIGFTITVADDATIGLVGNLAASLPGGNIISPAAFTVLPLDVTIAPILLTLNLDTESSISDDLSAYVSGGIPPYTFTLVAGPTQGELTLNEDGTFTYSPDPGASGTDQFTFTVTDSEGVTLTSAAAATGTVTINIIQADSTATATPTATAPATPSATTTPTQTGPSPTATEKPVIPGRTPTATAISGDESGAGNVTQLPSTGTNGDATGSPAAMLTMLALGLILLSGAAIITRRRTR